MTKEQQHEFITGLVDAVKSEIMSKVDKMPEAWDGIELRQFLADKFADAAYVKMPASRRKAYRNTILVDNL